MLITGQRSTDAHNRPSMLPATGAEHSTCEEATCPRRSVATLQPTPCLELVSEALLLDEGSSFSSEYREIRTAALRLSFDYDGTRVEAEDPTVEVYVTSALPGRASVIARNFSAEARARRHLESLGPLEIDALADCIPAPGHEANYLVDLEGDPDVLCHFSAHILPQLRSSGWKIEQREDYPFDVVSDATWYSSISPAPDQPNWFELELGVDVGGKRVDLLPLLLELLQEENARLDSLTRRNRPYMAVQIGGNRHLAVPPERVQAALRVLQDLYEIDENSKGGLKIPDLAPGHLEELELQLGVQIRDGCPDLRERFAALASGGRRSGQAKSETPLGLRATLRPYQQQGLCWLQNLARHGAGAVLADDMGLGKTLQTIAHICAEKQHHHLDAPALVVAPTSLVGNWQRELSKFAPHLEVVVMHGARRHILRPLVQRADVVITTYGTLHRDLDFFVERSFHLLILDEAQMIKNARSQSHRAVEALNAELRLCLTGTPIENNLEELRALFGFLMPGLLGNASDFRTRFRLPIERLGNRERLDSLRRRIGPFILRRMKHEVATDLPPKTQMVRAVEIEGEQRDLYEGIRLAAHAAVRTIVKKKGFAASTVDILGALMKLRQVCCDPRLVPVDSARDVRRSAKFDELMEMVPAMLEQGRRILIFSQFTSMLALISEGLRQRGIDHLTLTGNTTDRQKKVDDFESKRADVFLISLKAGGTGLNLTSADTVIHYDPWWNPAAQSQATDRAYRIGQKRPVFVYNLIIAGSVEERMLELQRRKQDLADGILAGESVAPLTQSEVDNLLEPLDPD